MPVKNLAEQFCADLFEKGFEVHKQGHFDIAETLYRAVIKEQPDHKQALHFLGMALHQKGKSDEAVVLMENSVELDSRNPLYYNNISDVYISLGQLDKAEKAAKKAIRLNKSYIDPYLQMGIVLSRKKQYLNAVQYYRQALKIDSNYAKAHNNLGNVLRRLTKEESAFSCFEKAIAIDPYYVDALSNLGLWYLDNNNPEQAISYFEQAIELKPNLSIAHLHLSLALLLTGQFQRGWEEYEWRHLIYTTQFQQPIWDGTDFTGKTLLIHAEQGLGDTIQFARYIPQIKQAGGDNCKIIFQCPKSLHEIFKNSLDVDQLIDKKDDLPEFDLQIPLLSLARVFDTDLDNIPLQKPYLQIPKSNLGLPKAENNNIIKVGVVWSGNPGHRTDHYRSVPFQEIKKFFGGHTDINFYCLQKEIRKNENVKFSNNFIDCRHLLDNFADTAILLSQCDLVISVDTSVAHLSGALGIPTWVFIPQSTDWRWLKNRVDSPWYPSMKLFRQAELGSWQSVWKKINSSLGEMFPKDNAQEIAKSLEKTN